MNLIGDETHGDEITSAPIIDMAGDESEEPSKVEDEDEDEADEEDEEDEE